MFEYREIDLGTEFVEPIGFSDMSNVTPEIIINNMKAICKEHNIPASFEEACLIVGGAGSIIESIGYGKKTSLFKVFNKQQYKAVKISHPNPPQSYCDQLYVILEDGIKFFYVGSSKAFKDKNDFENAMNGNTSGIGFKARMRAMVGIAPDEEPYNKEMEWHELVYSVFESLIN